MEDLRALERIVIDMLLAGELAPMQALREQARHVKASRRRHTGACESVELRVASSAKAVRPTSFVLDDVELYVDGLDDGVAVMLYIENGLLSCLEFACAAGDWPREPEFRRAIYLEAVRVDATTLAFRDVSERHMPTVEQSVAGRGCTEESELAA